MISTPSSRSLLRAWPNAHGCCPHPRQTAARAALRGTRSRGTSSAGAPMAAVVRAVLVVSGHGNLGLLQELHDPPHTETQRGPGQTCFHTGALLPSAP